MILLDYFIPFDNAKPHPLIYITYMFVIYKVSEYSWEADYFVRLTEKWNRYYSTIWDAMEMSEEDADNLILQWFAKYKEKLPNKN